MLKYIHLLLSKSFFKSFKIYNVLITKKETDVLYYLPQHFDSSTTYPFVIRHLINSNSNNKISYYIFEEPNIFSSDKRNSKLIPADSFWLLILILRKFYKGKNYFKIDLKIGAFLKYILLVKHDFKNIITVSQSMQSVLKGLFPNANHYDYQHGILSEKYFGYINKESTSKHLINNSIKVLLYGNSFKEKLLKLKGGEYFIKNAIVIGSPHLEYQQAKKSFNNSILFSLQFTSSHSNDTNIYYYNEIYQLFKDINDRNLELTIYLKSHPRFDNCIDISSFYKFNFVKPAPTNIQECFDLCTLHITEYSTVVFDAIIYGIPTLLTKMFSSLNILENEYHFPSKNLSLLDNIEKLKDPYFYSSTIVEQVEWSKKLYQVYDEKKYVKLMNEGNE